MSLNKLRDVFQQFNKKTNEPVREFINGKLVSVGGSVEVSGRPGYVWAVEDGNSTPFQVLNLSVQATDGVPVVFGRSLKPPYEREVLKLNPDIVNLSGFTSADPFLVNHATSHQWPDGAKGNDAVLVYQPALQMLKTTTSSGLNVYISPVIYVNDNVRNYYAGETTDLSSYLPSSGYKKYILISLDPNSGAIVISTGTTVTDVPSITPPMPDTNANYIPSAYVLLIGGATSITSTDILDSRFFLQDDTSKGSVNHLINNHGLIMVNNSGTIIS